MAAASSGPIVAAAMLEAGKLTRHPPVVRRGGAEVLVREVSRAFGPIQALRGISLSVAASEFVTITGPSGSGKSTLLNLIGGLDRPDSGVITVARRPVPEPADGVDFRRRTVGFVFQDNLLLPQLSAQSNVAAALLAAGVDHRERHRRSSELLAEVGLADRAGDVPSELSGGQLLVVSHDAAVAERADRVVRLVDGHVI
jgi:putative ABC transport system ATP-binding protein